MTVLLIFNLAILSAITRKKMPRMLIGEKIIAIYLGFDANI